MESWIKHFNTLLLILILIVFCFLNIFFVEGENTFFALIFIQKKDVDLR